MHDLAIGFDKLELAPYRNEVCFRGPDGSLFDGVPGVRWIRPT